MASAITLSLDKGGATGIDATLLKPGQLQEAEGVAYSVSDPAISKVGGRSAFNASAPSSAAVNGINFNSFDTGTDYVTAQVNGTLYSAPSTTGVFVSARTGLTASAAMIDRTKFADASYMCNGTDTNWVHKNDNTTIRLGLLPQTVAPTGALGGTGISGTFVYWCTEYDSTNGVESATAAIGATLTQSPVNQTVTITKPATINSSATHWRLYRTQAAGAFPNGWLVATVLIGTTTFADSTSDAALVLLTPYPIVTINDIPEGQNFPPPVLRSITTHEGSLVGVADRTTYFTETGLPHYWPVSYALPHRPLWGGQARCVRSVNKVILTLFDHDTFRINTLPKQADSFFDAGVVQEHIGSYGTFSPLGACKFSGWGGTQMLFFWDKSGPMLTDGNAFDRAVDNIDTSVVPFSSLATIECHDNPARFRVEVTFLDANSQYRRFDFYYESSRITQQRGFPELCWTGPHLVPGPGTYGVLNGAGVVWTGSRYAATLGKVYQEDNGTSDAAQIVDSSGTVRFRARSPRIFLDGINSQGKVTRIFLSKRGASTGTFSVTLNSWYEGDQTVPATRSIKADTDGAQSDDFDRTGQSFDVRIVRDDAVAMPPINNVTLVATDVGPFVKTNRR